MKSSLCLGELVDDFDGTRGRIVFLLPGLMSSVLRAEYVEFTRYF